MYSFLNLKGEIVEVEDLDLAIKQAKEAISFHDDRQRRKQRGEDVLIFPEASLEWNHDLLELEKLKMKEVQNV